MSYVLSDIDSFVRDETIVAFINFLTGGGLVAAFGQAHRRMRRALSPSFSSMQLKKAFEIIASKAALLSDKMADQAVDPDSDFNCCPLLDSAALDSIAEAGFGYKTRALEDGIENSLLAKTYSTTVKSALGGKMSLLLMIGLGKAISPRMVSIPLTGSNRTIIKQKSVLEKVAMDIIQTKKGTFGGLDKDTIKDELSEKDILSSIVRNNLTSPANSRLSEEELLGQVQTCAHEVKMSEAGNGDYC
ncbi:hypothetical protein CBS101457_005043 [Exobasidium rhododendri]|nr:hypothetical protein CBS101457_005043 [Exobasidium rhododendri]